MRGTGGTGLQRDVRRSTATAVLAAVLVVLVAVASPAVAAEGAAQTATEPSLVVDLAADGSAEMTLTLTYDLATDDQRAAFRTLQNDSETRTDARERFRSRMAAVASDASAATGREMSVGDASLDLRVSDDGSVGVAAFTVDWSNMAATRDGTLVVTEPFASGFEPDRPFTIRAPDGTELASTSPSPDSTGDGSATWTAGTDLTGFEATIASADDADGSAGTGDGDGGSGIGAPGFGALTAALALVAAGVALARRRT